MLQVSCNPEMHLAVEHCCWQLVVTVEGQRVQASKIWLQEVEVRLALHHLWQQTCRLHLGGVYSRPDSLGTIQLHPMNQGLCLPVQWDDARCRCYGIHPGVCPQLHCLDRTWNRKLQRWVHCARETMQAAYALEYAPPQVPLPAEV